MIGKYINMARHKAKEYPRYTKEELLELPYESFIKIPIRCNPVKRKMIQAYSDIVQRCSNPKDRRYKWYGAKGIKCEVSKEDFYKWYFSQYNSFSKSPLGGERSSVGRIDHSKGYNLSNIEIVTIRQNCEEQNSRLPNPCPHANKLNPSQVLEIFKSGQGNLELSKKYGVTPSAIYRIKKRLNWRKLTGGGV